MATLDTELHMLLLEKDFFEKNPSAGKLAIGPDEPLYISIQFTGDIAALAALGFEVGGAVGQVAYGATNLAGLEKLAAHPQVVAIEKQRRMRTTLDDSIPDIAANQVWTRNGDTFTGYTGRGVIVGVIDSGIDFRHRTFRKADGLSRILKIWDQTLGAQGGETVPGPITHPTIAPPTDPPVTLGYGVVYDNGQINDTLNSGAPAVPVRHVDQDGHGTHVAGIAAGDGSQSGGCHGGYHYIGVATEADLMVVRLWGLSGETGTPPSTSRLKIDAIKFLMNEARLAGKPIAINLSMSRFTELIDGSSSDCRSVDTLLTANSTGRAVVFSAGNNGDARFHAVGTVPAGPSPTAIETLRFKLADGDSEARNLVILYAGSNLQVKLTSPVSGANGVIAFVSSGGTGQSATANGGGAGSLVSISNAANRIEIGITPPTGNPAGTGTSVEGTWTLELKDSGSTATPFHAFCLYGSSHDPKSPFFLDHDTAQTTLGETGSAKESISVGSYKVGGRLSSFSARGPTLDAPPRTKPDICAPGEDITSAGVPKDRTGCQSCCCECCQDFYVDLSGTSQATPHVTGVIALMLHRNPGLTHTQIKAALTTNSAGPPSNATPIELVGWGGGPVNAKRILDNIKQVNAPVTREALPEAALAPLPEGAFERLRERFLATERGPFFDGLFARYFREVFDLVQTNKRVATIWHRCRGPIWIRLGLKAAHSPGMPVPMEADGVRLQDAVRRFLGILRRYASQALLQDIGPFENEIDRLGEGMTFDALIDVLGRSPQAAPLRLQRA